MEKYTAQPLANKTEKCAVMASRRRVFVLAKTGDSDNSNELSSLNENPLGKSNILFVSVLAT